MIASVRPPSCQMLPWISVYVGETVVNTFWLAVRPAADRTWATWEWLWFMARKSGVCARVYVCVFWARLVDQQRVYFYLHYSAWPRADRDFHMC